MPDKNPNIDALFEDLLSQLPDSLRSLNSEVQNSLKRALSISLQKMDLVTRHEFDIQQAVLLRTREKLEQLEKQLAQLEEAASRKP